MGTSWACSESAATRLRRAGARFVGEAGRGCYCARCQRGWTCCERPEEERRGRHYAQVAGAGARTRQGPGTLRRWGAAATSARLRARALHAGAMDLLRAAGHDGRARPRRGTKNGATRGCQDTANAHGGRENGEGERGRGELTSADERRRSGGDPRRGRDEGRRWWARNCAKNPGRFGFGDVVGEKTAQSRFGEDVQCSLRVGLRAAAAALHARVLGALGALGALGVRLGRDCARSWAAAALARELGWHAGAGLQRGAGPRGRRARARGWHAGPTDQRPRARSWAGSRALAGSAGGPSGGRGEGGKEWAESWPNGLKSAFPFLFFFLLFSIYFSLTLCTNK
jgi:hypothetical protein